VGWVVPESTTREKVLELVRNMAKAPKAVGATKSLLLALEQGEQNLSYWKEIYVNILSSPERQAAVAQAKERLSIA
jgi:hypothetical protein